MGRRDWRLSVRHDGGRDGFARFRQTGPGLWPDHRAYPVPASRPPMAAAILRVAGLRPVSEISRTAEISRVLAGKAGRAAALGAGRALQADQAGRAAHRERRIPAALAAAAHHGAETRFIRLSTCGSMRATRMA